MSLSPLGASRSLAALFTPIKSGGLVDEVCARIELAIETGLLSAGQRLPNEVELASALGVSAVTTREALSQLRGQGLIRTVRGRSGGSFIADDALPSPEKARRRLGSLTRLQISDLSLHYQAIASACAGLAARRATPDDLETLQELATTPGAGATDPLTWRMAHSEFILEIAAAARSARLARELLRIQAELGTLTILPFGDEAFREEASRLHQALASAIERRDSPAAESLVRELIHNTSSWLLDELSAGSLSRKEAAHDSH
ncbi:FadR/GntR family transcriptional regulator [Arthrobacter sp. NPDC090010]|uniref:FadR/GntR family transcriptional regulator n=1 Tax=Arthrobacter sp. NPDC090010 TaxID=3363942 RepID=UPI00382302C5